MSSARRVRRGRCYAWYRASSGAANVKRNFVLLAISLVAAACGGGGSGGAQQIGATGTLNVAITDAAVDDVAEVWVEFSGVSLKPQSGGQIDIDFDTPKSIDLLKLQNGNTEELLPDTLVPAGPYNWIRLGVNAEFDNVFDSFVMLNDGTQRELRIPSGSQSGLKLVSGFTVTQNQSTNIVVDWDLRKALSDPQGQPGWHLRPALRVTDMAAFGTLTGSVDATLLEDPGCTNDLVADTGNAVYIYNGEVTNPEDISGAETDPLVTATVTRDVDDVHRYEVHFLSIGEYTVALTCQASDDDPEADDDLTFAASVTGVAIVNGETTVVDF